jgi:hypothetical protein
LIDRKLPGPNWLMVISNNQVNKEHSMMDVLMLGLAFGLFALAIGYAHACERL